MVHVTGNATWADFPSTSTLITASTLNNIEGVYDHLYTTEYGAVTRTKRPLFRAVYNSFFSITGNAADLFMSTGWTVATDTDSAWTVPGAGIPSYYTIPISGRVWDLSFKMTGGVATNGDKVCAAITINSTSVSNSIARDTRRTYNPQGECTPTAYRTSVPLTAGDKLYFAVFSSVSTTLGVYWNQVIPEMYVKDVGPAS